MSLGYVPRMAEQQLGRLLRTFPAALVVGPRQSGKSTLVRHARPAWPSIDLERPTERGLLESDPEGFLTLHSRGLVIDEVQRMPDLFSLLRVMLDRGQPRKGRLILTGSASPAIMKGVSESLAGRVGILELTPFLHGELSVSKARTDRWFWGGYPPVLGLRGSAARSSWLDAYVSTFLERDVPALGHALSPVRLRTLWTMLTHVHGNLLNLSDLARSLGVSFHTVQSHLDLLEGAFLVRRLPPFFANIQKRLTKSPKVYVRDTGLLHFLAGLRSPAELETWSRRGSSFEGQVIEELAARAQLRFVRPGIAFWRTQAGAEVDLVIQAGRRMILIEIKLGTSVDLRELSALRQAMADLGAREGWVVYSGPEERDAGGGVRLVPWADIAQGRRDLF